ncbi:unnamed protein product [Paramecium octaurelia]|uniref:Uncharacterized protein n=1 Tax=Paramecium octaurelia TaxID=43137 RepID=A0A8S1UAR0_PAROT|nr:unnamed protein product [Paramecium octaurelia]
MIIYINTYFQKILIFFLIKNARCCWFKNIKPQNKVIEIQQYLIRKKTKQKKSRLKILWDLRLIQRQGQCSLTNLNFIKREKIKTVEISLIKSKFKSNCNIKKNLLIIIYILQIFNIYSITNQLNQLIEMGCKVQKPQSSQQFQDQYELISEFDHYRSLQTLSINKTQRILVSGSDNEIKFFQIQKGCMKLITTINTGPIFTLNFFNTKDHLISGLANSQLLIWGSIVLSKIKFLFKLKSHAFDIRCTVLHPNNEDLIVSGSNEGTIKFWGSMPQKYQQWSCLQTIYEHSQTVNSLAINSNGNKLLSCSDDKTILIIESDTNQQWHLKQRIRLLQKGYRLSFITDEVFSFQPNSYHKGTHLYIFKFNSSYQQFEKRDEISVRGSNQYCFSGFPSAYIQSKKLLIIKNGYYVNLLKVKHSKQEDIKFTLEQSIEFGTRYIFGTQTEDGDLLITWDEESKQIQIRKLISNC